MDSPPRPRPCWIAQKGIVPQEACGETELRNAAVREMKAVMMRLAKGEAATRMWRHAERVWRCCMMEEGQALSVRPEAEMKAGVMVAAVT